MGITMKIHGPERLVDQGLGPEQEESGNRAIAALLADDGVADQMDLVLTFRAGREGEEGAYEVWSARGMVRFQRYLDEAHGLHFEVLETLGVNPLADQDPHSLRSVEEEMEAARASGFDPGDPAGRFIAPEYQSYPFAYERVAQLFDSPHAPDLAISPRDWCQGNQPGMHGALHVRQSRGPLWIAGSGIRAGQYDLAARSVDIAPTCLAALGFPLIDGLDQTGRSSSDRGKAADVLLGRQDGRVLSEILVESSLPASRLYIFLLDGIHHTELEDRLARDPEALPNLRRLRERAAVMASGHIVTFPSITWPSHTTISTGTWAGHHDVVNPTYYLREKRESVSPQGQQVETEAFASNSVESLAEAFHRVQGSNCMTAAIHAPFGRSAKHAPLERRNALDRARLREWTETLGADRHPRWAGEFESVERESTLDGRGVAQVIELFTGTDHPAPSFVFHELVLTDGAGHDYGPHSEGLADALDESDRRVGRVLDVIEEAGLAEEFVFVVTSDHGMAPQDVALNANPAWHVDKIGMAATIAEPMIWLRDLAVEVERAPDGRTGRVFVYENDRLPTGERPSVEAASVEVFQRMGGHRDGPDDHHDNQDDHYDENADGQGEGLRRLAKGTTGPGGVFGFGLPSNVASDEIELRVSSEGFNDRHLRLNGEPIAIDLRAVLFGSGPR